MMESEMASWFRSPKRFAGESFGAAPGRSRREILLGILLAGGCFVLGLFAGVLLLAWFGDFPSVQSVEGYRPSISTKIYDRNNRVVGEIYLEKRTVVPYREIPPAVVNAFLAAEDAKFFSHKGVDFGAIARAAVKDILRLGFAQGGSTITQQTVKNLFLTPEKSVRRKVKEMILAYRIERKLTKEEILFLYLNQIYLGDGAYGVEAAARSYFGKGIGEVNLAEAALLAGLAKAPSAYSPRQNPDLAKTRQRYVLRRMAEIGVIPADAATKAYEQRITLAPPSTFRSKAAYFLEHVRLHLMERYGAESIYREGLSVYTTIDRTLQEEAHDALLAGIRRTEEKNRYEDLQGALVVLDPQTGGVLAMVGGADFAKSQFNRAIQARRQPGSAFKPVVYSAALDAGRTVVSRTDDSPVEFPRDETELWKPRNYDGTFLGPIPLLTALAQSRNLATVRLLDEIGVSAALRMAEQLGIESPIERNLSIALGSSGVTLLELCGAYATFANGGKRVRPHFVREIRDGKGAVLERDGSVPQPAISPETAYLTVRLLQEVIRNGTGRGARGLGPNVAGKTGTTNENTDAWFLGFSPDLLAGVWIGFDTPRPLGDKESAAVVALPIWNELMGKALARIPPREFPVPPGIAFSRVDPETGRSLPPGEQGGTVLPFRLGTVPEPLPPGRPSRPGRKTPEDLL